MLEAREGVSICEPAKSGTPQASCFLPTIARHLGWLMAHMLPRGSVGISLCCLGLSCLLLAVNAFLREIFEERIIQIELPLEGAIGEAPTTLEQGNGLVQNLFESHGQPFHHCVRP